MAAAVPVCSGSPTKLRDTAAAMNAGVASRSGAESRPAGWCLNTRDPHSVASFWAVSLSNTITGRPGSPQRVLVVATVASGVSASDSCYPPLWQAAGLWRTRVRQPARFCRPCWRSEAVSRLKQPSLRQEIGKVRHCLASDSYFPPPWQAAGLWRTRGVSWHASPPLLAISRCFSGCIAANAK